MCPCSLKSLSQFKFEALGQDFGLGGYSFGVDPWASEFGG